MNACSRSSCRRAAAAVLIAAAGLLLRLRSGAEEPPGAGESIYRQRCASCHGESGQGVKGKRSTPLAGDQSVAELAKYIEESMPEDAPGTCTGEDAKRVALYIHDAFYSPIARARLRKARIDPVRLTVRQYRNAAADLVGAFRQQPPAPGTARGLRGEYFNSGRPGGSPVLERVDAEVRFEFGKADPVPEKLGTIGFSARWQGAVIAPDTGDYQFIVRTGHSARLWINDPGKPLIDAWVKSGNDTEYSGSIYLLGGRAYFLRLEFTSRKQGVEDKIKNDAKPVESSIQLLWKRPRQSPEVIPVRQLAPERPAELYIAATPFPPDERAEGYERGASAPRAWDDAATAAAIEAADYIAARADELAGIRKGDAERPAKIRDFCGRLVERAFRRPLGAEERQLFIDRQFAAAPDAEAALKRSAILALKSPRFLYLHLDAENGGSRETASRLSFALWDSLPDGKLLESAAAGRLRTRGEVLQQADRMLEDPRARSKVLQFLHQWLNIENVPDLAKDEKRFPGFDAALAADLRTSLDLFLEDAAWSGEGDFRRLFLSSDLYVNGRLASFYGYKLDAGAPFQKVEAESLQGAGLLAHPYLLSRFAYADSSSPIHRGVFIARGMLGRALRPPPEAVAPLAPDLHPSLTTRERVARQTEPKACQGCHGTINPLGFALEQFDAVGRFRAEEKGKPIDATGSYLPISGERLAFQGAGDLARFLAGSEEAHRAFVTQLFHHLAKQPIFAYGRETPEGLRRSFTSTGFSIRKLLAEIAATAALEEGFEAAASGSRTSAVDPPRPGDYNDSNRQLRRVRKF